MKAIILDETHREDILRLEDSNEKHMRHTKDKKSSNIFKLTLGSYLNQDNKQNIMWGVYDGAELLCINAIFVWAIMPYYTQLYLKSTTKRRWNNNGMAECWEAMLQYGESLERYKFFYVRSTKWGVDKISSSFFQNAPSYSRYIRTVEEFVPKGHESKYSCFRNILGTPWDYDNVVIGNTLRPDFRNYCSLNKYTKGIDFET